MKCTQTLWTAMAGVVLVAGGLLVGSGLSGPAALAQTDRPAVTPPPDGGGHAELLSRQFRQVAQAVTPAVVEIRVERRVQMRARELPEGFEDFFRGLPPGFAPPGQGPQRQPEREFRQEGLGAGVIVDAANGYILTNNHVIAEADEVQIRLHDGRMLEAEWVRRDPMTDLAVVKVTPDRLTAARLGDSDAAEVGDWVLAIGNPEGLTGSVTAGIISAKGRAIDLRDRFENYIQTDAAINRGNSGGPLVNMAGEVIGINTAIITRSGASAGLGLAIPSNMARMVLPQLVETGRVVRGYLGVTIQDVSEELARSFGLDTTRGSLVTDVLEDSPAARAGLEAEDFVVAIDGRRIENTQELRLRVAGFEPDSEHVFTVIRDGRTVDVPVVVGERPDPQARIDRMDENGRTQPDRPAQVERLGLDVQDLTPQLAQRLGYEEGTRGVAITQVRAGSDAAQRGLRPGMLIRRVNRTQVATVQEFRRALEQADLDAGVRLFVQGPGGGGIFVMVMPQSEPQRQ